MLDLPTPHPAPQLKAARTPGRAARAGFFLCCAALLACPTGVGAQSEAASTPPTGALKKLSLEELTQVQVVSVSKHPEKLSNAASAIQVITAEQIRRSGAATLPEALRLADNLDVAQKNSHDWAISSRGFNTALANKLLVLIDGRSVYTPLYSGVFWDTQDYLLADVERIEVISGPGGTLWGANAVNGVINIITRNAKDTQGGYSTITAGTQLQDHVGARYGFSPASDVYFRVYGKYFERGDEILANGAHARDSWNQGRAGFRLDAQPAPANALTVQGDAYRGDEGVVGGAGTVKVSGNNVLGRWTASAYGSDMSLQIYRDHTHLSDPIPTLNIPHVAFAPGGILQDDLDTWDVDFQDRFNLDERNRIEWGLGYRHTHDEVENVPAAAFLPATLDQSLFSAFVQDEITLGKRWSLVVGTKLEHNDYTGLEVEPSARAKWDFAANQMLWAAISRAVRTPSRIDRDLFEPAPAYPPAVLQGTSTFVSETVIAYELGYRAAPVSNVAISIAAFYDKYDHERSTSTTPVTLLPLFFQNNVEGNVRGIELSADWQVCDAWRLHAGFDPLRDRLHVKPGRSDLNNGQSETPDPHERLALRSSWDLPQGLELDASLRRTGERVIDSGTKIQMLQGYSELDMRLSWHATPDVEVSVVGQNLLHDHHVEYGFAGPSQVAIERSVYARLAWHF